MQQILGETLSQKRKSKGISIAKAARDLLIKKEQLQALEDGKWEDLPQPPFVRGFIKNYGQYLNLDTERLLALYRREYDESKYPQSQHKLEKQRFLLTPQRVVTAASIFISFLFILYLIAQYLSISASPKLEIFAPPADSTTTTQVIRIDGKTEKGSTVSVNGEFAPVDTQGNFVYQYTLEEGQNVIEIIAAKRLSPKTKITRVVRLAR